MAFFGALAGFNKGACGGGYSPVITIGGLLSGIPPKTMVAVTALSEGTVCFVSVPIWLYLFEQGAGVYFVLLPSMILGSMFSIIIAPFLVRVLPKRLV